jgi:hypothetical protein
MHFARANNHAITKLCCAITWKKSAHQWSAVWPDARVETDHNQELNLSRENAWQALLS